MHNLTLRFVLQPLVGVRTLRLENWVTYLVPRLEEGSPVATV